MPALSLSCGGSAGGERTPTPSTPPHHRHSVFDRLLERLSPTGEPGSPLLQRLLSPRKHVGGHGCRMLRLAAAVADALAGWLTWQLGAAASVLRSASPHAHPKAHFKCLLLKLQLAGVLARRPCQVALQGHIWQHFSSS